jgi:ATP-dependent helicase/nuclease subunit A
MYQRIHGALGAEARTAGGEAGDRARIALKDFFHAHIQTLDSYCVYLVKQGAARYGIRPDFTVDDEGARELALRESLPFLISRVNHPALEQLYREKRPQDIARDMFAASVLAHGHIDRTPAYARGVAAQFGLIHAEWTKARGALLPLLDELASLCAEEPRDNFLVQLQGPLEQYRSSRDITEEGLGEYLDALLDSRGLSTDQPLREELIQWLHTLHKITYARANIGKRNSRAKAIVTILRQLFPVVSSILVYALQGGLILQVMILLDEFQHIYVEKKRSRGILTFSDVARLARTILRDQKDIRNNEKAAFRAIMIDEFQDNNALQKELLYLLAEKQNYCADGEADGRANGATGGIPSAAELEEGKLFFVGDEKQSIYRFRGADVSVFRELKTELAAEDLNLGVNYRSSPELIALFNAIFGGSLCDPSGSSPLFRYAAVFPPAAALPPYEADYSPLRAGIDKGGAAAVYILDSGRRSGNEDDGGGDDGGDAPTGGDESDGDDGEQLKNDENEAAFIAAKIRELLEERDEKGLPRFRPDDIAILFRTRSPQRFFEKHLRLLRIPYAAEGLSSFFADGPVNDMAAFLRLIAYPLDTEAYAVFLRSPFAGLSIEGLAVCMDQAQPFAAVPPLADEGDRRAWEGGRELYLRIREKAAGLSIGQLLSELWYGEGYRYETIWNPRTRAHRELFDYLYSQALRADEQGLSIAAFSDRLEALRERDEPLEDTEIPLERSGAVRLLTVHKSKGLEFKVVFIVCCGKRGRNGGAKYGGAGSGPAGGGDLYCSSDDQISFNPPLPPECADLDKLKRNFFYERDRLEERRRETAELRRLLYVAMTRARERLFLSGSFPLDLGDGGLLESLAPALEKKIAAKDSEDQKRGFPGLEGDRILDNNTFFGLLLPALAEPRGQVPGPSAQFSPPVQPGTWPPYLKLGLIPPLSVEDLQDREPQRYPNTRSGLDRFLNDSAALYAGARVLHSPVLEPDHLNASAAGDLVTPPEKTGPELWRYDPALSGEPAADIFGRVDPILSKDRPERSFAEFGTLAHLCVEEQLSSPGSGEIRIPPGLAGSFSPAEIQTLLEAGKGIAGRFLASPLGREAREAPFRRSEYPFRCLWNNTALAQGFRLQEGGGIFINGVIDLIFERDAEVRVVDFKTDNNENPQEHLAQMSIYRRAARELLGKPCRVWLYYLRTGRAVEIANTE